MNGFQWLFFIFFAGGSAGGWLVLILLGIDRVRTWRGK